MDGCEDTDMITELDYFLRILRDEHLMIEID